MRIPYPAGYNLNGVTPANILPPLNLICQVVNYIRLICWDDWFVVVGIRHYSLPTVKPLMTPSGVVGMVTSPPVLTQTSLSPLPSGLERYSHVG